MLLQGQESGGRRLKVEKDAGGGVCSSGGKKSGRNSLW